MARPESRPPPFAFWACLWGLGAAIPLVCIGVDLLVPNSTRVIGRDFALFWAAGRVTVLGDPAAAYSIAKLDALIRASLGVPFAMQFSYPPPALFLLAPFGAAPYPIALALWILLGATFFCVAARPFLPFSPWLAVLTPAALLNIWDGQFGFVYGGLWLLAFRFTEARPVIGGSAAALLSIKPHLAPLAGLKLVQHPRAIVTAIIGVLIIVAITLPLWALFVKAVTGHAQYVVHDEGSFFYRLMPTAYAAFGRHWPIHLIFAGAAAAMLLHFRRFDCFSLSTATFLIIPYAHNYDMTVACVGPAILLYRRWTPLAAWERGILASAFVAPALTFALPQLVPPILLACLWLQLRFAAMDHISPAAESVAS